MRCTKVNAGSIRPNRPTTRRSTATPKKSGRSPTPTSKRPRPTSRAFNRSSINCVVYAPVASQVYQRNVEPGEYVSPGVPLVTLIDLADLWIHFDLREDLVKNLKVGDRFDVRIPAA